MPRNVSSVIVTSSDNGTRITCTGLTESKATTVADIIDEIASTRVTERGGRADDKRSETAMEDRKKAGYF